MNIHAPAGTKVKFKRHSNESRQWSGGDETEGVLEVGGEYTVDHTEVHSFHTKVYLVEHPGKKFSSGHFE